MRYKKSLISILLLAVCGFVWVGCQTSTAAIPDMVPTAHYDGYRFRNLSAIHEHTLAERLSVIQEILAAPDWQTQTTREGNAKLSILVNGAVSVTFIGHNSLLVRAGEASVLFDPVFSQYASPLSGIGPKRQRPPGMDFEQLPKIDFVMVSHNHYDHMDIPTLQRIAERDAPLFIVPLGNAYILNDAGIKNVVELDWWQSRVLKQDIEVTLTPAQHFSSRGLFDRNKSLWGSFILRMGGKQLFFAGDTGYSDHFKEIRKRLGSPDIALLPIGAYEPYSFMRPLHMNPTDAVRAHRDLQAKKSFGMHFGTFRLTAEAQDQPVSDLALALEREQIKRSDFLVPREGGTYTY